MGAHHVGLLHISIVNLTRISIRLRMTTYAQVVTVAVSYTRVGFKYSTRFKTIVLAIDNDNTRTIRSH